MVDNEVLFEDVPYDQETPVLDLSGYSKIPGAPGYGRGNLITFRLDNNLTWDTSGGFTGAHLYVYGSPDGIDFGLGYDMSIGIGPNAGVYKGMHFTLPDNTYRYIKFAIEGAEIIGGTYTIRGMFLGV